MQPMTKRNTAVLKSLNQIVKETGDIKKMGCNLQASEDNRMFYRMKVCQDTELHI